MCDERSPPLERPLAARERVRMHLEKLQEMGFHVDICSIPWDPIRCPHWLLDHLNNVAKKPKINHKSQIGDQLDFIFLLSSPEAGLMDSSTFILDRDAAKALSVSVDPPHASTNTDAIAYTVEA